ncbi:MAG: hypothetical protein EHM70_12100 [Chloroflexota bacterium]|nr:MAG: hypothetical protein EHM70_12100 [Chloroflexota bacterium]
MDKPSFYEIRIEGGHLTDRWSEWFEGLAIHNDPDGGTTLSGALIDQAALMGVLGKIQALNLTLISVNRLSPQE